VGCGLAHVRNKSSRLGVLVVSFPTLQLIFLLTYKNWMVEERKFFSCVWEVFKRYQKNLMFWKLFLENSCFVWDASFSNKHKKNMK
jgi:hypothetical protein